MKESARYAKIVEWSEDDQCIAGRSPGLVYGGCHGPDEKAVFEELCQVVEDAIALYHQDGKPLPRQTAAPEVDDVIAPSCMTTALRGDFHFRRPFFFGAPRGRV